MAPRAMSSRGRLFIVPLVVLSVVLVALVVAILVLVRGGGAPRTATVRLDTNGQRHGDLPVRGVSFSDPESTAKGIVFLEGAKSTDASATA